MHRAIAREAFQRAMQNSRLVPCGVISLSKIFVWVETHDGFECVVNDPIFCRGLVSKPIFGENWWFAQVSLPAGVDIDKNYMPASVIGVLGNLPEPPTVSS